ncbi:uncharacterized protein LOC114553555 [Perca flavescens]|uniref:uncharacterized protein LOC114553555 n=1 Tax=Perca flavescens TaxID=8167 RepID=UPI00106EBDDB|nr:uncharacterized protein LOC114553555 [Perca flavescens]
MRNFLLIFLSLMITGWEASSDVKGCTDGWVEFTCQHKTSQQYHKDNPPIIRSTQKNVWQTKDRISVYHDTANRKLRVVIKPLQHGDSGEYKCKCIFDQRPDCEEVYLNVDDGCQTPLIQTAYRTAKTTISCDKRNSRVMFFCKDNGIICENILSPKSSPKSNGSFTLTETSSSFTMSISNVSSQHAAVYWCGVETDNGRNRAGLRKIQLKVDDNIKIFTRSPTVGENLTYWCGYPRSTWIKKFICKGEDPSTCKQIVSTAQSNAGKFSMMDDKVKNITITVRNITTEDSGTYWCGAERNYPKQSNPFFHRFMMTVVTAKKTPTPPTFTVSSQSTPTTTASAWRHGGPGRIITVTFCVSVVVLLLLFVLILILIYKRKSYYWFTEHQTHAYGTPKTTWTTSPSCMDVMCRKAKADKYKTRDVQKTEEMQQQQQHIKEEYIYEEIQEHPHHPDSGNAPNTIYATANFPTTPSASLHYSTVIFTNCSDKAGAETLLTKPSSSACEYSTVKKSQSQTSSSVNQPSSEDPLYSTVNKSREQ